MNKEKLEENLIELKEMVVLSLKPGDQIVLTTPNPLSDSAYAQIQEILKKVFPNHSGIILENGTTIKIVRPEGE